MTALLSVLLFAERAALADSQDVKVFDSPGGQIAILDAQDRQLYDNLKFAPARRAGDYVYISGIIIARDPNTPPSVEAFKAKARDVFRRIQAHLRALGADLHDVVMINSFHDWSAPEFNGDRRAQARAFNDVKEEFMGTSAHPAWTVIGTTGLLNDQGITEVQMIAYAPLKKSQTPAARLTH